MLKRLFVGIIIGLVVGGLAAAALIKGLGILSFATASVGVLGMLIAYGAALATGAVVALVAGKPVWAKGAWIEVGLKAFFGSLLAAGGMFALRRWGGMTVDLSMIHAGSGSLGSLPATSLPIIATVLSMFFEVDNTDPPEEEKAAAKPAAARASQSRVSSASSKGPRVATEEAEGEEELAASKKLKH
jgi:hypothetical protein